MDNSYIEKNFTETKVNCQILYSLLNVITEHSLSSEHRVATNDQPYEAVFSWLFSSSSKVDLKKLTIVKRILTQGRQDLNQWVTSYIVTYSRNGNTFRPYTRRRRIKVCPLT